MKKSENVSIGYTALKSHERDGIPIVTLNYVGPEARLPLPSPKGDSYLRQTAVPAAREGEVVVCNTLIPGLLAYYQDPRINLLSARTQIVEVEPDDRSGFPYSDPLERLRGSVIFETDSGTRPVLSSTFLSEPIAQQAKDLGMDVLDRPDSSIMNDKAFLRRHAAAYDIRMLPGVCVDSQQSLSSAQERFANAKHGVWIKAPTGSGGDLVYHVRNVTEERLLEGRAFLYAAVERAFIQGNFSASIEHYWPSHNISPTGSALVIESDARNIGKIIVNGSTQFVTNRHGAAEIIGDYEQITSPEGEYLGNRPYHPNTEDEERIHDQVFRLAQFSMDLKNYGIQASDWFLLEMPNGEHIPYVVEWNSRPTANTPPVIMADKLCAASWINTNAYTDVPIRTIGDYIDVIGPDFAFGSPRENGLVVPQAFRTTVIRQEIAPSPNFKILIAGKSHKHCDTIAQNLSARGVRFIPE